MSKLKKSKKNLELLEQLTFECIICYEKKSNDNKIISICAHGPYCTECFNRILELTGECSICKHQLTEISDRINHNTRNLSINPQATLSNINDLMGNNMTRTNIVFNHSPVNSTIMHMVRELNQINNTSHELNDELSSVIEQTIGLQIGLGINSRNTINQINRTVNRHIRSNQNQNINIIDGGSENFTDLSTLSNYINSSEHGRVGRKINSNGTYSCSQCLNLVQCDKCEEFGLIKTKLYSLIELMENIGN